ncbi:MAG: WD40 repeat [Glomeribacter sp. 1016415]|nr:WD40 repeat [Glomeribacter sp. 1016415]
MLGNPISQNLVGGQLQVLAQSCLYEARRQKTEQHLEMALALYDQAKVTFKQIADARQLVPLLTEVKKALTQARTPQTAEEDALRQRIAEIYYERAELLDKLGKFDKAQSSYKKAQDWGYEVLSAPIVPAVLLSACGVPVSPLAAKPAQRLPVVSSAKEKSELIDYFFEKVLLTLSPLEVSNRPSLFLVYAHNKPAHGEAEADTAKYLINKLSEIQFDLYSDKTATGRPYARLWEGLKGDGKVEDILTSQFCLLPHQLRKDVKPVDKVVVCCSEVLGNYLKWPDYKKFYEELREAYCEDLEAYHKDCEQPDASAIRQVVKKFSQEEKYKAGFHHVLTEIAFLEIRVEHLKADHGIIPVSLTRNSYKQCLAYFIPPTTVREDIPRFEARTEAGQEVYPNQRRHEVLLKLIERLLINSDEAKTFLNRFRKGHEDLISRLRNDSMPSAFEFAKLSDSIFGTIEKALHRQLVSTVQQQNHQLRELNVDPRAALKERYFSDLKQDKEFDHTLKLYVEPRGKASLQDTNTFNLLSKVQIFLNDKDVILLMGDSGAGKTTFNRVLEKQLWDNKKEHDAIPLFISLSSIEKLEHDLISKALKKRGLLDSQIQTLKNEKQRFVFILDGYDEIRQTKNLYLHNLINQPGGWQGRMVISCRSEYLGQDYQSRFQPNPHLPGEDPSFQEAVIEPFSEDERNQYLEKYVAHNPSGWAVQQYRDALGQRHLKDLVSNPFLLRVVLDALPYLENEGKARTALQLRMDLYDQFVRQWFERNQQRLRRQNLTGAQGEIFNELCDDGFAQHGIRFVKDLAVHLFKENAGKPVVDYSLFKDEGSWKDIFFGRGDEKQLLREAWPLSRSGNQYRFIHKSLFEYFVARSLFESLDECMAPAIGRRRGSDTSVYSFENQTVPPRRSLRDISLAPKHWVSDFGVVRLLTERVEQEAAFKIQLFTIIERSKTDAGIRQAAANAITILVKAGVRFNGADLKGIQVPGADLGHGEFDFAQLQGADLRKVHLRTIWLRNANLSGAQMDGVKFGELPFLEENSEVKDCTYSPDGKNCAVALKNGTVSVYDASNWEKIHTLHGHASWVNRVTYSPSNQQIASCSEDNTVRLWDAQSGQLQRTLSGHTGPVWSVIYSPRGQQIASCSEDNTVCLWDAQSGQLRHTLSGHTGTVWSVTYSPNGQQIASGSEDNMVRLWETRSGQLRHIFRDHTHAIWSVRYSPNGEQIVSCSEDNTVRLWDAQSGQLHHTLGSHTGTVRSVRYSPCGQRIASCSEDNTVRLWDAQSGQLRHTLLGHAGTVLSVAYSPSGQQIASCSEDNTVRLWDAQSGQPSQILSGHTHSVRSVTYSPNGQQIASGSWDTTVRLWDAQSGQPSPTLSGHTSTVLSVTYSPGGQQLASYSEDKTVCLWDAQSGRPSHTLRGHTGTVRSVRYSPGGQQLASGSLDKTVRLWDAQSGQSSHILSGHTHAVWSVKYSPSGQEIASGSEDKTVRLWDAQSGQLRHTLWGHTHAIWRVVYSPNGQQLASGSEDKTVRLWDVQSGQSSHTLHGHKHAVLSVRYSPSGEQIASCSRDKTVRLWDTQSGQLCHTLSDHTGTVWSLTYSPSGEQLASCSRDTTVRLWDTQSGKLCHTLSDHTRSVLRVRYSPNGQQIASCSDDTTVRLWDTQSGRLSHTLRDHTGTVLSVTYSPSGQQIASCGRDTTVRLWDVQLGQPSQTLSSHTQAVLSVIYSPSGEQIVSCSEDNTVSLWDAQSGQLRRILRGHTGTVRSVTYSPNDQQIASSSDDNTVRLWDAQSEQSSHTLFGHTGWVNIVTYSPSSQQIASCSSDNTVRLWDAQSGQLHHTLYGHAGSVLSVAYSPSGEQIASGSLDKTVRLWDVQSGQLRHTLSGHTGTVRSVTYSPSGQQIASCSGDTTVRLWDAQSGQLRRTLSGHTGTVKNVMYSPSGQQIASYSEDKTVRLWDAQSGQPSHTLREHTGTVRSMKYSPSGQRIASGSDDKTVRLWDAQSGLCQAVISDFLGTVRSVAWKATPDGDYLVTGCEDESVRQWQVIEKSDQVKVRLCWSSAHTVLTLTEALIQDVHGLSRLNKQLLKQHKAIGV